MTGQTLQNLGTFAKSELPETLSVTFKDGDGVIINLTGFTAKVAFAVIEGNNSTLGSGTVEIPSPATDGIVTYAWHSNDFSEVGLFQIQLWVDDGTNTLASELFQYAVEAITVVPTFA